MLSCVTQFGNNDDSDTSLSLWDDHGVKILEMAQWDHIGGVTTACIRLDVNASAVAIEALRDVELGGATILVSNNCLQIQPTSTGTVLLVLTSGADQIEASVPPHAVELVAKYLTPDLTLAA